VEQAGDLSPLQLAGVLHIDQREHWQRGEPVLVEDYLGDFPSLTANESAVLDLLYGEFVLREELGQPAPVEEYLARFPSYAGELKLQLQLHQALDLPAPTATGADVRTLPISHSSYERNGSDRSLSWSSVSGYEILEELGRGGMGVVYRARQRSLNREVALKMLRDGPRPLQAEIDRLRREAETLARLHHPNIVQIYEVGEQDSRPFFSLEFVEGGSLHERLDGKPQPPRQAAQLVETLARAIHAAHQQGIVHRDLKPANVLLLADGSPKITDFGLAKQVSAEPGALATGGLTRTGDVLGTPRYMAPEQAAGQIRAIDARTDIHALGVILYELLTGRPPFLGETTLQTLEQVRSVEPVPPARLQPKLPRDLDTICMKCLAKAPARRYATALDLAEDLRRFQNGEAIRARPVGLGERAVKWVRRRPVLAALIAVLAAVLATGLPTVTWLWQRAESRAAAEIRLRQELETHLYFKSIALAECELLVNNVGRSEELLDATPVGQRGWEWNHLKRRRYGPPQTLQGHRTFVTSLAGSADGRMLASAGFDGVVKVWDSTTGKELRTLPAPLLGGVTLGVAFSPDGRHLASSVMHLLGCEVRIWNVDTGKLVQTLRGGRLPIHGLAYSPDGRSLATGGWDGTVKLWDTSTGKEMATLRGHADIIQTVVFSPDGTSLASASWDGTVKVWNPATATLQQTLRGSGAALYALAYSPDGQSLAAAGFEGVVRVWDVANGQEALRFPANFGGIFTLAYSPDGTRLAAGGTSKTVQLWDAATGRENLTLRGHTDVVSGLVFSPDSLRLISASWDGTLKVWDGTPLSTRPVPDMRALQGHKDMVLAVAYRPASTERDRATPLLASAGMDGQIKLWDPATGTELRTLARHDGIIYNLAFRPDGRRLVSTSADRTVKVWDVETGQELLTIGGPDFSVPIFSGVVFSPDGRRLAGAVGHCGAIKIWDAESGAELLTCLGHQGDVYGVAFSPDGKFLASGGWDQTVRLWDARTGAFVRLLRGHTHLVSRVAFSPDGLSVLSTSWDGTLRSWDPATGRPRQVLHHGDRLMALTVSADGRQVATAGMDGLVRVWDRQTGALVTTRAGHSGVVWCAAFAPNGSSLASASGYRGRGEVNIWQQ
jgi:WD40 repeat protein/predicted Ser/Thr protein kinase